MVIMIVMIMTTTVKANFQCSTLQSGKNTMDGEAQSVSVVWFLHLSTYSFCF